MFEKLLGQAFGWVDEDLRGLAVEGQGLGGHGGLDESGRGLALG